MRQSFLNLTSEEVDLVFDLRINEIETELLKAARILRPEGNMSNFGEVLHEGHQTWVGLDPQTLNTPYRELSDICTFLNPSDGQLMIDLGAGYGRLGLVLHHQFPLVHFRGFELVIDRVAEGNRVFAHQECKNAVLLMQDMTAVDFQIPVADYYFIYDFGKTAHIRKILSQLEALAEKHHFKVIARGKGSRSIIDLEHPWLSDINDVHRAENYSIYSY